MELLINYDAVLKRELYKKYKFNLLQALSHSVHLISYPRTRVLCYEMINYCISEFSTYETDDAFSFDLFGREDNTSVASNTKIDLKVYDEYLKQSNDFFKKIYTDIDQDRLRAVLSEIKEEYDKTINTKIVVDIQSHIGTPQSSFKLALCGSTKNFFSNVKGDTVSEILEHI